MKGKAEIDGGPEPSPGGEWEGKTLDPFECHRL